MVKLISENLAHLGGPMGSEYTTENFCKLFKNRRNAKKYAEKDYGNKLEWLKDGKNERTNDLRYVMYHIKPVETED
jgi:hypothetical protein